MEIIIGTMPPLGQPKSKVAAKENGVVEAQLLHIRPPRRGIAGPSGAERRQKKTKDPVNGRVLTLMVADGNDLPRDLDKANYRITLRFQRK